ncbi:iron uptake transporter permease EfeU [uncultured Gordonia sp.]|uniref:iron uptake transporter permease EfeU n=1 Tax=uncultured Gordonia sp. TaxID=198437 RepID=UPI00259AD400|nr:iron uptake transporter permease EfeU [uncultured Gordonia sp.]
MSTPGQSAAVQLFGSGLIGVREGLEAGVVVMLILAILAKSGRRDAVTWLWTGVAAAAAATAVLYATIRIGTATVSSLTAELVVGIASLTSVAIVTLMVLWMNRVSTDLSSDLASEVSSAVLNGRVAVMGLAFLAVGREGLETALLMASFEQSVGRGDSWPMIGLAVGVCIALLVTALLYRGLVQVDIHKFFYCTAFFLVFVAAGILSHGVRSLQDIGWLPGGSQLAFDISDVYDQTSWYGTTFAGILNFRPDPTFLQLVAWALYIGTVTAVLVRGKRTRENPYPVDPPGTTLQSVGH